MRKILFRCKLQESGEWIYWDMLGRITTQFGKISKYTRKIRYGEHHYYFVHQLWDRLDRSTVGQYTGRKDKNKNRIFEGDVVVSDGCTYVCRWDDGNVEFSLANKDETVGMSYLYPAIEVIGNIHDNLELLGGADV